ncbi:hypothetical protein NL676_023584 [Syzygium grande]|nr:hypothetical protein NL676_023584 [Syzygium grande]
MEPLSQFALILVLSLTFTSCLPPSQAALFRMYHVHIVNNLPGDFVLHCKSKNNDLRARTLQPDQEQLIRFRLNIFKKTLFFCSAQWETRFKQFNAFTTNRDEDRCDAVQCIWSVRDDGFYFTNDSITYDREYTWD